MKKKLLILFLVLFTVQTSFGQNKKYFDQIRFEVYQGYRKIKPSIHSNEKQLDFLNYMYTQPDEADYPYFELATKLRHNDSYQLDMRLALYNNLIPYCYNIAFNYYLNPHLGINIGSSSNRYYLTEFNDHYNKIYGNQITTRYIQRQWNISLIGFYLGPTYQLSYQSLMIDLSLNAGMSSFYPFAQKNIIKTHQSNHKLVLEYQTHFMFLPFISPEIELSIDFMHYRNVIIGGRVKYAFMYTKSAIKYEQSKYEWTYDSPDKQTVLLSKHSFSQSDIDFGIFARW